MSTSRTGRCWWAPKRMAATWPISHTSPHAANSSTAASTVTYLLPIVALTLGTLVLNESLSWTLFAGTALVLLGIAISEGRVPGMPSPDGQRPVTAAGHSDEA